MRRILVAGNWKMNGRLASADALAARVKGAIPEQCRAEVVLCPPFVHLSSVAERLEGSRVSLGAQDVCEWDDGASTGDVSAEMLVDIGCRFVIVGHSERRIRHAEPDERVARKYRRARDAGLVPILCLGESLEERESGRTTEVVERQLSAVLEHCTVESVAAGVIAYEPVWAIGTGRTASPGRGSGSARIHPLEARDSQPGSGAADSDPLRRKREGGQRGAALRDARCGRRAHWGGVARWG